MMSKEKPHEISAQGELRNLSKTPISLSLKRLVTLGVISLITLGGNCTAWAAGGSGDSMPGWMVLLLLVVLLVVIGCFFRLVVLAFQESPLWGLAVLFLPFGIPIFVISHWGETKNTVYILMLIFLITCIFFAMLPAFSFSRAYARVNQANFGKIKVGMTQAAVEKILGQPWNTEESRSDYTLQDGYIWRLDNPVSGYGPIWKAENSTVTRTIFEGEQGIPVNSTLFISSWGSRQRGRAIMVAFINGGVHQWAYRRPVKDFISKEVSPKSTEQSGVSQSQTESKAPVPVPPVQAVPIKEENPPVDSLATEAFLRKKVAAEYDIKYPVWTPGQEVTVFRSGIGTRGILVSIGETSLIFSVKSKQLEIPFTEIDSKSKLRVDAAFREKAIDSATKEAFSAQEAPKAH